MTTGADADTSWSALSEQPDDARVQAMTERYRQMAGQSDEMRAQTLSSMINAEFTLDDVALLSFTSSRLNAIIAYAREDMDGAKAIAGTYDQVFDKMGAVAAMRRASMVQTAARTMPTEDIDTLDQLFPSLVRQVPRAHTDALTRTASQDRIEAARQSQANKKPFWKFW
jgi:alkanesulfonate monooxygenase SsuD/methylene tetrahydromethanopterin reductase-like flavin-dependent oxidoreductase (luciferase family)